MRNVLVTSLILGLALFLSGCRASNPYPILDDAKFGDGTEANLNAEEEVGLQNVAPQRGRQVNQQQIPQPTVQQAPTIQVSNEDKEESMQAEFPKKVTPPNVSTMTVTTNKGEIVISLFPNEAPETITNYVTKAKNNFYNNLIFHRVEDWVVQGGDPKGNGTGGGSMPTELSSLEFKAGSVGVARGGDLTVSNDAQFFICITDCSWLNGKYTLFGEVKEGMEIAKKIQIGDKIESVKVE